jgi:hypothetical protein
MTSGSGISDLVVLISDKNMEFAIKGILGRNRSLHIREICYQCYVHPHRDPGCLREGHLFLKPFVNRYQHAIILFDHEGCGKDTLPREELETKVENCLTETGWGNRSVAVVIDPELEMWVWSDSPNLDSILGWEGRSPTLRDTLRKKGLLREGLIKPSQPKETMEFALRSVHKPRSSSLYQQIAQKVSLDRCVDPSFIKLKTTLQKWFPAESVYVKDT